ncbi:tyrosine-type recombinase/integrase [Sandarakinorhabdus sp. DWP1-3-1]|uniref:tyrosine-type recombinase/integrase n=1 Tax=Sandarakinorhabdus sp. DWP1-3-1 TaxID=2804627 RepID=UPI003CEA7F10
MSLRADREATVGETGREELASRVAERARAVEAECGPAKAEAFYAVASGEATPLALPMATYLGESGIKDRSQDEVRRSVRTLVEWCERGSVAATVEAIDRKVACRFVSGELLKGRERATAAKYLSFLSGYWRWLVARGIAETNPWGGQIPKRGARAKLGESATGKRPYTDDEAVKLLSGPASERLRGIIWIAALSGMRIDEICRLRVGDCRGGWFAVNAAPGEGKTKAATRRVPIHSALASRVAALAGERGAADYLIADLPDTGPGRERSMPAVKEYTRYRRAVGIDERAEGQRQSNVDFHSWRRWFARTSRDAGTSPWVVADLLGHDTESMALGMTMGTYSGKASAADLRGGVEAVLVPAGAGEA